MPPVQSAQAEPHLPWLGNGRFWIVAGALFFLALAILGVKRMRLASSDALVPVVALSGPLNAKPDETVRYAVLVRDRFGAAVADAPVRVGFWRSGFIELGSSKTGEAGDATVEIKFPNDFKERRVLVALVDAGVAEGTDFLHVSPSAVGQGRAHISTDKPLYQPGQVMHIRALAMADEKPIADRPAVVEIRAGGVKIFRAEKKTSAFGVVSQDFQLADQVLLGSYSINVTIDQNENQKVTAQHSVDVRRYSLPKLKVAFEDLSPLTTANEISGKVRASWIFGEPVTKGKISVSLERVGGYSGSVPTPTSPRVVEGQPDKDGIFKFELPPVLLRGRETMRGTYTLRAKLAVEGGMANEISTSVATREPGEIRMEIFPETHPFLLKEVKQTVYVLVSNTQPDGDTTVKLLPNGPSVQLKGGERLAKLEVTPGKEDYSVQIAAYGSDGSEGKLVTSTTESTLLVRPDRDSYSAGQTAKVRVFGAERGDRISLRLTRGHEPLALGTCAVTDKLAGCEASLTVPANASGLSWVHALSLPKEKSQVRIGKRLVIVGTDNRDLAIKATPDKIAFAPRETGTIDVAVSAGGGAPVQAQLGIAVADEAVFALANVRPDLEKLFFTINRDLEIAQGQGGSSSYYGGMPSGARVPAGYEASAAYQPTTPEDVRKMVLAALTTMTDAGSIKDKDSSAVTMRASSAIDQQKAKLGAWTTLLFALTSIAMLIAFCIYGFTRLRRPVLHPMTPEDATHFRVETRSLFADVLIAAVGPPILAVIGMVAGQLLMGNMRESAFFGLWFLLAAFTSVVLLRTVLRVRRTAVSHYSNLLRRLMWCLPIATFFGHFAAILAVSDKGRRMTELTTMRDDAFFVPVLIAIAAQITIGLLSVTRQTLLRPVTGGGRAWLLLSRASFVGLPFALFLFLLLSYEHVRGSRHRGWESFSNYSRDYDSDGDFFNTRSATSESSADNKEGGTGTRAKGEEGSMGNPNFAPGSMATAALAAAPAKPADEPQGGKGGDGKRVEPRTRDYFPETLMWAPEVITDPAGHAKIQVPFADSITTWRFGVQAVSKNGQLGSVTLPLVVKQNFFVDTSLPPILTQGDEVAMPVTIYSYVDEPQDVALEFESDGISAIGGTKATVHLGPKEVRGYRFGIRADKAGDRAVKIKAYGKARSDAVERKLKVTPNGLELTRTINGRLVGASSSSVEFPALAIDGGNDLYVKIYGGPLSQVAEGLDGILRMPGGCFEQTSSTLYPNIMALDFLRRIKTNSPDVERKAREYIDIGYQRILTFRTSSGGFSMFGKNPPSTVLTAYALFELSDMARVASVDDFLISTARGWMMNQRSKTGGWPKPTFMANDPKRPTTTDDLQTTAYITWALAISPRQMGSTAGAPAPDPELEKLLDAVAQGAGASKMEEANDPYTLALRANALLAGGRKDQAKALLDRLVQAAVRDDSGVHWTSKSIGVMYSAGESMDVELTGLTTHALALAERDPELRAGALTWLVSKRGGYGTWSTTQATVAAMRALLDEAKPVPREPQDITVIVDGAEAETYRMEPKARDVHHLVSLKKWSTTGAHKIELKSTGEADIGSQIVVKHYVPWQRQAPGTVGPLVLDVAYAPLAVQAGDVVSCKVHLNWKGTEPGRMPLVEIGIPPAFEVETDDLEKLVSNFSEVHIPGRIHRYSVDRGRVTLYLTDLPAERPLSIDIPLRSLRPAKVVVPSSTAYLYYEPEVKSDTMPVVIRSM